jgi:hypothetical protein
MAKPRWLTRPGTVDHHVRRIEYAVAHVMSRALARFYEVNLEKRTIRHCRWPELKIILPADSAFLPLEDVALV